MSISLMAAPQLPLVKMIMTLFTGLRWTINQLTTGLLSFKYWYQSLTEWFLLFFTWRWSEDRGRPVKRTSGRSVLSPLSSLSNMSSVDVRPPNTTCSRQQRTIYPGTHIWWRGLLSFYMQNLICTHQLNHFKKQMFRMLMVYKLYLGQKVFVVRISSVFQLYTHTTNTTGRHSRQAAASDYLSQQHNSRTRLH